MSGPWGVTKVLPLARGVGSPSVFRHENSSNCILRIVHIFAHVILLQKVPRKRSTEKR